MINIKDKYINDVKYKYHPYPKYDCWEFAKNRIKFNFWFNRDYTNDEYFSGYIFRSRYNDPSVYASKARSLLETNFCFDEYIYFRDIILSHVTESITYYDLKIATRLPNDKLYVMLADMRLMGEIYLKGTSSNSRKKYEFFYVEPVDYDVNVLLKDDYVLNVDKEFIYHFISECGYYQFLR